MIWLILILIWIFSCIIYITWIYYDNRHIIYKVGDIIDEIYPFMLVPIVNTITLILLCISFIIDKIVNLLNLSILWEKFRNIKLK